MEHKIVKSYTCKIEGTASKMLTLESTLEKIENLSHSVWTLKSKNKKLKFKEIYSECRKRYISLNSKVTQNFLRRHYSGKNPKRPVKPALYVDFQGFDFKINQENIFTKFWLRIKSLRINFPLRGKFLETRIIDPKCVKEVRIFKKKNNFYCKISYVTSVFIQPCRESSRYCGIDMNHRRTVSSGGMFFRRNLLYHRQEEDRKRRERLQKAGKNKRLNEIGNKSANFVEDYLHKETRNIVNTFIQSGVKRLIAEDLTNIMKNTVNKISKKNRPKHSSWPHAKTLSFLFYKCLESGIEVDTQPPAYTSKACSRCGSLNTTRPAQSRIICNSCGFKLDADLNAARNILSWYSLSRWAISESSPALAVPAPRLKFLEILESFWDLVYEANEL